MRTSRFRQLQEHLLRIEDRMKTVEVAVLVSGPGNPVVAEAYNGLRQQVVMAASERRAHLTQLAAFAGAVDDRVSSAELDSLVCEWMRQHSLTPVLPEARPDAYDISGQGPCLEVLKRAFVDAHTGAIIAVGQAVARPRPAIETVNVPPAARPPVPSQTDERAADDEAVPGDAGSPTNDDPAVPPSLPSPLIEDNQKELS